MPDCPHCGEPMRLARVVPALAGHPELRSYECSDCREVLTEPVNAERPPL
ncbi:MAG: hypothetical protein ACK4UO_11510 [Pseudolabrys sp.]